MQQQQVTAKIGAFPGGQIKSHTFDTGTSYAQALRNAGFETGEGLDVRVNGQNISSLEATVQDGDQVLIFSQIRGN